MTNRLTITDVNKMNLDQFVAQFESVYEHSPWVAEQSWQNAPFSNVENLTASFANIVANSSDQVKLNLLCIHPQLSGKESEKTELTAESQEEQKSVGLNQLSADEIDWLAQFNKVYSEAFGFPFIIAVKNHSKETIFEQMEVRLNQCVDDELKTALEQVDEIARIRLSQLIAA